MNPTGTDSPERPIETKPIGEVNLEMHGAPHLQQRPTVVTGTVVLVIALAIMVLALIVILVAVFKVG